ncbi:MAG TPA: DedA family protein [Actinomycetes bacterium]|nr:DedA family protein [Actinomycetes bacterium]
MHSAVNPLDPTSLIETFGTIGILAIIFAETGLLIGFFFPGDSLLFLAGVAASGSAAEAAGVQLPLGVLLIGAPICAIAGAQLGHFLGARYGPRMFNKPDSRFFRKEYVDKAEHYFEKFGPARAVVLARFIPIVRTFLNPVAGVLGMPARTFFVWNVVGALLWTVGVILLGYSVGARLEGSIDRYLLPVIALIIFVSVLPILIEVYRHRRADRRADHTPDPASKR